MKYLKIISILTACVIFKKGTGASESLVFLVTDKMCITNIPSAIAFNTPVDETRNISSVFFPQIDGYKDIDCKFDNNEECFKLWKSDYWTLGNSIDGPVKQLITDWRWEALPIYRTVQIDTINETLNYEYILTVGKENLDIPISVRAEKEAHVYLCDDSTGPHYSNCYWFMLQAFNGNKSAVRKCSRGYIDDVYGNWAKLPCKNNLKENTRTILSEARWNHFRIIRESNTFSLVKDDEELLRLPDDHDQFQARHVFVHSKRVNVLWKLHQYSYVYTTMKYTEQKGSELQIMEGQNCISMFIVMCSKCEMTVRLRDKSRDMYYQTFKTEDEKWKEVRILFNSTCKKLNLFISTDSSEDSGIFWAIDHVRRCSEKEYRILKLPGSKKVPCQIVENEKTLDFGKLEKKHISELDANCPESRIGKHCIPCQIFRRTNNCGSFKYCESVGEDTQCFCTPGFESQKCDKRCNSDQYGHGCKKYCSNCEGKCSNIDGYCFSKRCRYDFKGDKCDIPPVPLFKTPPKIVRTESTSCAVQLWDFENNIDKPEASENPPYFKIQYKKAESNNDVWVDTDKVHSVPDYDEIVIKNLQPDTEYYVRALLYSDMYYIYEGESIKKTKFRTTCIGIEPDDILIKAGNASVNVTFKLYEDSCQISNYVYSVGSSAQKNKAMQVLILKELKPFTEYCLTLSHIFFKKEVYKNFTTLEGVPSEVQELTATGYSNSISLKWTTPREKNGIIIHYLVKYRLIAEKGCPDDKQSIQDYILKYEKDNTATMEGLNPYSIYEIRVCAVNRAGAGKDETIEKETEISEDLDLENEIPTIQEKKIDKTNVILILKTLECNKIKGPIYLTIEATCKEEWCHKPWMYSGKYDITSPIMTLTNLFPDVNYELVLNISRHEADWSQAHSIVDSFKTNPGVPNHISDVTVTSKDENSISLRWMPPYPPTGALKKYRIKYYSENAFKRWDYTKEIDPTQCRLWHDFHCATITEGVKRDWTYYIDIWATNESPLEYAKVTWEKLDVIARVEAPETPYDLTANWTWNNDLQISWKHPNATNGLLQKFTISLSKGKRQSKQINGISKNINSEDDYNSTYTQQIEHTGIEPCSEYTTTVKAHNKEGGSKDNIQAQFTDWSPPPIPSGISKKEFVRSITNHTIEIKIPPQKYDASRFLSKLYLLIAESANTEKSDNEIINFENYLRNKQEKPVLVYYRSLLEIDKIDKEKLPTTFTIGNDTVTQTKYANFSNPPLKLGIAYNINLFFVNECKGKVRIKRVNKTVRAALAGDSSSGEQDQPIPKDSNNGLYALILLILLIPLLAYVYRRFKKDKTSPVQTMFKQPQSSTAIKRPPRNKKNEDMPLSDQKPATANKPNPVTKPRLSIAGNVPPIIRTKHSKSIKISDFELYVKESIENGELVRQHRLFPRGQTKPWDCGALKVNKSKNRYNNLIAYDHTRVKLSKIPGVEHSDYINANYVDGYRSARAYIATQGPKNSTLNDFWKMIWNENVKHILMLANLYEGGKKKVEKYWPDINEEKDFNGIRVQYVSTEVFANYEYRVFNVYNKNVQRKVEQLHFTTWPDHGVPLYSQSLVPFLQQILKIPNSSNSPVVVHCSAGVGRTGTIILCDICLRMAAGEGSIDFLAHLENLRSQRANMVDNEEQYKLAHLVVFECLFGMHTSIACNEDMDDTIKDLLSGDGIKTQLRYLVDTEWQDKAMDTVWDVEENPTFPEKNRFQDIVPEQQHRVFLVRYPPQDESSSYINAVQVDGFRSPGRFIVTQQPMPNTLGDFWRLVIERKSTVIISLNEINKSDKTSCQFWPEKDSKITPVDYLQICHVNSTLLDCYRIVTVRVINQKENENILVNIISINNWMPNDLLPNSVEEYLSFWEESDVLARQSDPVVITCYNGATASGLYIATSFIIEKMKLEQECDVCLAVRTIRHNRKQFVTSEEQFEFLYRVALTYINGFQSYANFA